MADCLKYIKSVAGDVLSDDELEAILEDVQSATQSLEAVDREIMRKGEIIASDALLAATIEKRNRYRNVIVEAKLWATMKKMQDEFNEPRLGLEAMMVGVNTTRLPGGGLSVDALGKGLEGEYIGGLIHDLEAGGLTQKFNTMAGDFERDVSRALYAMSIPDAEMPKVGADALAIARIMDKYRDASLRRLNLEGGYVRKRKGFVIRQTHRPDRLASAGFDKWREMALRNVDFDRMNIPPAEREGALREIFDSLESGVRLDREMTDLERSFKGPGNIAKKDAAHRVILFKGPDEWLEYDRAFGHGSLREGFVADLNHNARVTALMMNFGTNPRAMLDRLIERGKREWRSDKKARARLRNDNVLQSQMDEITGDINLTSNMTAANLFAGYRAVQTMAKLGASWVSALLDVTYNSSNRMYQGRTIVQAWGDALAAPFETWGRKDKRRVAELLGVGFETQLGGIHARFNAADQVFGKTSKLMNLFFRINMLGPWTDANKRGAAMMISRDLAMNAGKDFSKLSPEMRRLLGIYDIDAKDWDIIRRAVSKGPDDVEYLLPGDVAKLRGDMFAGLSELQQEKRRAMLKSKLFALMASEADFASPSPGARERAILRRGYRPGTAGGEALRFIGQFKSFSVVSITKVMGRHMYGAGETTVAKQLMRGAGANLALVNTILMTTFLGMGVYQIKEMLKGRKPRPLDQKLFMAGLLQGGGLGIYGDFLFGEANRFGGGTLGTIAGPGLGTAGQLIDLLQKTRGIATGSGEDARGDALRLLKQNLPFANLFYTRAALDYLLWYRLQESINPGYLRRMERRVKSQNGQEYFIPPSSVAR